MLYYGFMAYAENNTEKMRLYMRARYHQRREEAIEILGGRCTRCGVTEALQVDHIDPALKTMSFDRMTMVSEVRFLAELVKCQLLCEEHHIEKTARENGVPHGGGVSGKRNCRCAPCKAQKAEYMRVWKRSMSR